MKLRFISIIGLLLLGYQAHSQTTSSSSLPALRHYVTIIHLFSKTTESGILFDLDDSTLTLAPAHGLNDKVRTQLVNYGGRLPSMDTVRLFLPLRTYRYSQIKRLTLHRRGQAAKGFLIGAGIGALSGLIAGDDEPGFLAFSAGDKAAFFGITFSLVGLIVGGVASQEVNAKGQSIATKVPARFRTFTITDQVRKAMLYTP